VVPKLVVSRVARITAVVRYLDWLHAPFVGARDTMEAGIGHHVRSIKEIVGLLG
jgi:hypothetical protein